MAPPRLLAFAVTAVAVAALMWPIWYTAQVATTFGPFGTLIAWTCVTVAIFGILTVVVSTWRSRLRPPPLVGPSQPEGKV